MSVIKNVFDEKKVPIYVRTYVHTYIVDMLVIIRKQKLFFRNSFVMMYKSTSFFHRTYFDDG